MVKPIISISLDEKLLKKIDECRGDIPRSKYIENILFEDILSITEITSK